MENLSCLILELARFPHRLKTYLSTYFLEKNSSFSWGSLRYLTTWLTSSVERLNHASKPASKQPFSYILNPPSDLIQDWTWPIESSQRSCLTRLISFNPIFLKPILGREGETLSSLVRHMHALEVSFALLCWKGGPPSSNGFSGMLVGLNSTSFPYLQKRAPPWVDF